MKKVLDYCYPNTKTLINKPGIMDAEELSLYESELAYVKLVKLVRDEKKIEFTYEGLMETHKYMFDELYEWAGKSRLCNMSKRQSVLNGFSVNYTDVPDIRIEAENIINKFKNIDLTSINKLKDKIDPFCRTLADIWKIHPFREGNTRSIAAFFYKYGLDIGLKLDIEYLNQKSRLFRNSLVLANHPFEEQKDIEPLKELINRSLLSRYQNNNVDEKDLFSDRQYIEELDMENADIVNLLQEYENKNISPTGQGVIDMATNDLKNPTVYNAKVYDIDLINKIVKLKTLDNYNSIILYNSKTYQEEIVGGDIVEFMKKYKSNPPKSHYNYLYKLTETSTKAEMIDMLRYMDTFSLFHHINKDFFVIDWYKEQETNINLTEKADYLNLLLELSNHDTVQYLKYNNRLKQEEVDLLNKFFNDFPNDKRSVLLAAKQAARDFNDIMEDKYKNLGWLDIEYKGMYSNDTMVEIIHSQMSNNFLENRTSDNTKLVKETLNMDYSHLKNKQNEKPQELIIDKNNLNLEQIENLLMEKLSEYDFSETEQRDEFFDWIQKFSYSGYSLNNQIFISRQARDAKMSDVVATYNQWKELGYSVLKGAKSEIGYFYPLSQKMPVLTDKDGGVFVLPKQYFGKKEYDKELPKNVIDNKISVIPVIKGFAVSNGLFSLSQTNVPEDERPELLQRFDTISKNPQSDEIVKRLTKVANELGITVERKSIDNEACGFIQMQFETNKFHIVYSDKLPPDAQVQVLTHEIGHFLLHRDRNIRAITNKATKEVQAELFSCLTTASLGVSPVNKYTVNYIGSYAQIAAHDSNSYLQDKSKETIKNNIQIVSSISHTLTKYIQNENENDLKILKSFKPNLLVNDKVIPYNSKEAKQIFDSNSIENTR